MPTSASFTGAVAAALACVVLGGCSDERLMRAQGRLEPSGQRLDFGAITLGLSVQRQVTFTQRGRLAVQVAGGRVEPADAGFSVSRVPQRLGLDEQQVVTVVYRPLQDGLHRAVLELELVDGEPVRVTLEGRGVDARAELQGAVDFGRPALGAVRHRTLVLRNDRPTPVPATLVPVGADAHEFSGARSFWVEPFSELSVGWRYEPQGRPGRRDVWLELVACPLCDAERVDVFADAVEHPVVVSPDPVTFGSVQIDSDRTVEVSIMNATDEWIVLEEARLEAGGDAGFVFWPPPAKAVLLPLVPLRTRLGYTPTHLGPARASLFLRSDAEPEPEVRVEVHANGGGPQLVVVPAGLDFGEVPAGGRAVRTVTVANGGADPAAAPLTLQSVAAGPVGFTLLRGFGSGTQLRSGEQLDVLVAFEPEAEGSLFGQLTVVSNDPNVPEVLVPLSGRGVEAQRCELQAHPPVLDFGGVRAGKRVDLATRLENVGSAPCTLWEPELVGDAAFTLPKDRFFVSLSPGESVVVLVRFAPPADGPLSSALRVQTSRPDAPTLEVPVQGGGETACLRPDQSGLAFGLRRLDCGPAELTARWVNACSAPVDVSDIWLGPGTDDASFALVSHSPFPAVLPPGARVEATVRYAPLSPGYTVSPLFARSPQAELPSLVAVSADAQPAADREEIWVQPQPAKVDVLWVVDNTASMKDKRDAVAQNASAFVRMADARGIDYHLGVTTTGVGPAPDRNSEVCPGGAGGDESGRLFPVDGARTRIVGRALPGRETVFAENFAVGGCHSVEQGFKAAQLALSEPLVSRGGDGNRGLLREDAALWVVVVSDEDDKSPGGLDTHVATLQGLKRTSPFSFSAVAAPPFGCSSATQGAERYFAATQAIGGVFASICESDWSARFGPLLDGLFQVRDRYALQAAPDPASLVVTVNGRPAQGWHYDPAGQAIVFQPPSKPGDRIVVRYREPCPAN